jgi:3',5'-cyclic AMP phosphodiesterase CpdA
MRFGVKSSWKTTILFFLAATLLVAALLFPGCGGDETATVEDKTSEEVYPKIQEIIYPILGYPSIVPAGEEFTMEVDFTMDDPAAAQPGSVEEWQVSIASSNAYVPYKTGLEVTGAEMGTSQRWLEDSGREVYDVYLVDVKVPEDVPPDLYDLEVSVKADGEEVADSQPNTLSVVDEIKDNYKFVQVTDIHVYDVEPGDACMNGREFHNAVYLSKAIEQINMIDPDFVVFTGDLVFAQLYLPDAWPPEPEEEGEPERRGSSEYDYEDQWAYQAMSELDVPCFYVMGNHDGYWDTQRDGYEWWTNIFGPLYYSFDYGNDHYTMLNTMDWSQEMRLLEKTPSYSFAKILEPVKWKGQVESGGDEFGAPAPPPDQYGGQLGWIRDDLAANQDAGLRLAFCHHDPTQLISWEDDDIMGYRIGGNGEGMMALQALCADNNVDMLMSGHEHHDLITMIPWSSGQGDTIYANTTTLEPVCGVTEEYPGYRIVEISGDEIASYVYKEPKWSYPYYDEIVVGQENDLDAISMDPAIDIEFSNGGEWSLDDSRVTCTITNKLERDFTNCMLKFYMPSSDTNIYQVSGVTDSQIVPVPDQPDWTIIYAYFDLPALSEHEILVAP